LNETVYGLFPDVETIAEESTAFAGVSRPTYTGGLGFGQKVDDGMDARYPQLFQERSYTPSLPSRVN